MISLISIAYILTGLVSVIFLGGWILSDRGLSWTFLASLMTYIPTLYFVTINAWKEFIGVGLLFLVCLGLYNYDRYYSKKSTKGGRR